MPLPKHEAWFPAKRYGWGWDLPRRWQGWVVMLGFFGAVFGGLPVAEQNPELFAGYAATLVAVLVLICYWKGETPRWRWGDRD